MFSNRKAAGLATQITSPYPFVVVCLFIFDSFIISHHSACRLRPCALQSETIWRASAYKFYSFMTFRERGGCSDVSSFPGLRTKALMTLISASFSKPPTPKPPMYPSFSSESENTRSPVSSDFALEIMVSIIKT